MRHDLAAAQTALLELLHTKTTNLIAPSTDPIPATSHFCLKNSQKTERGLRAYRANAQELSEKALQASYPVMQQLLGEENFRHLAQDLWQALPPKRGDLAQWGQDLEQYLFQVPQLQAVLSEHPYLRDVARMEWALHTAATASDAALDTASFQLLAQADPAQLRLVLSPGCFVVLSAYPVVSIMQLHDDRRPDAHEAARVAIAACDAQIALIWRRGLRPMLMQIDPASAALIEVALKGLSLAAAVDAALAHAPDFDFSAWLSASVQSGLLIAVSQL